MTKNKVYYTNIGKRGYMQNQITCSFFGHRRIEVTDQLVEKVKTCIEFLIVHRQVSTFLFGSRSEFDTLCLSIVSEFKRRYPVIKRVAYTCKSEGCFLESERQKWEVILSQYLGQEQSILTVDEEFEFANKYKAGKASYIERNQAMIDASQYCIFYYDDDYRPQPRNNPKDKTYQTKSGTALAYNYARCKNKKIINMFVIKI